MNQSEQPFATLNGDEGSTEPRYARSAVAIRVGLHVQTIRRYEEFGLVFPHRTHGGYPLYSDQDIDELERIRRLTSDLGINLPGVAAILHLRRQVVSLQQEVLIMRTGERSQ